MWSISSRRSGFIEGATTADECVAGVSFYEHRLIVDLMDGRTIAVPLAWNTRLFDATIEQRQNWRVAGAGFAIHWPDIDEDLSTEGLMGGALAPGWKSVA